MFSFLLQHHCQLKYFTFDKNRKLIKNCNRFRKLKVTIKLTWIRIVWTLNSAWYNDYHNESESWLSIINVISKRGCYRTCIRYFLTKIFATYGLNVSSILPFVGIKKIPKVNLTFRPPRSPPLKRIQMYFCTVIFMQITTG